MTTCETIDDLICQLGLRNPRRGNELLIADSPFGGNGHLLIGLRGDVPIDFVDVPSSRRGSIQDLLIEVGGKP